MLLLIFVIAVAFDLLLGEVLASVHPVVWLGNILNYCKSFGLRITKAWQQFIFGSAVACTLPFLMFSVTSFILTLTKPYPWLYTSISVYLLTSSFAITALGLAGKTVAQALRINDINKARFELRALCSRDSSSLTSSDLASASISSVSENFCDSIVAPLFYFCILGVPGAILYRTVNTMDAVLGYRGNLEYLGKAAARLDDLLNLVPARITGFLLLAYGSIYSLFARGIDVRQGFTTMISCHHLTPSPNGGWPMSAMAGLLRVRLEKKGVYTLLDSGNSPDYRDINRSWQLVSGATTILVCSIILLLRFGGLNIANF